MFDNDTGCTKKNIMYKFFNVNYFPVELSKVLFLDISLNNQLYCSFDLTGSPGNTICFIAVNKSISPILAKTYLKSF